MHILILYNPIAGRGRGRASAMRLHGALAGDGHDVALHETSLAPVDEWLDPLLAGRELLVVVGGDGAMRMAAPAAVRTGTPIYQCPLGTENLFSREFGMDPSENTLRRAIAGERIKRVDVAAADGHRFLLMVSLGFDADVIHDLATRRNGRITHLSYAAPIIRQIAAWTPSRLSIDVDGASIVDAVEGFVIVANCRQYARRLDPAARAVMDDGLLDVAFFPAANRRSLLAWTLRCARRRQVDHPACVYRTGRRVRVACDPPRRFQLDGDRPEMENGVDTVGHLDVSIEPRVLRVLIP